MPKGSPGERRGRRGPNAKTSAASAKKKTVSRKRRTNHKKAVAELLEDSLVNSERARAMLGETLIGTLELQDFLRQRVADETITSEEGAVMNGACRNIQKLLERLGVDNLGDPEDEEL